MDNQNMEHRPQKEPGTPPAPRKPQPPRPAPAEKPGERTAPPREQRPQRPPAPKPGTAPARKEQATAVSGPAQKPQAQKSGPVPAPGQKSPSAPENAPGEKASPARTTAPKPQQPPAQHMAPKSANLPLRRAKGLTGRAKALIAGGVIALVAIVGLCVWFFGLRGYFAAQNAEPVFVSSVSSITGVMSDLDPRYSGLVEPQQVTKVNKDESRTVADMLVQEGDPVTIGQPLFSYDTGETDLAIRQAELELEGIANELTVLQDSKTQLEKEQKDASKDDQFKYTVEIQSVELQIKSKEYDRSVKQSELEKLQNALTNNQVLSEVDGVVQEINLTPASDSMGNPLPFMSILSSGEFRIKGTITEMNINSISEGQTVTVRSRVDPSSRWTGSISSIEYEPVQDNNNMYGGVSSGEKASKYNFYVTLDAPEGLILGQHVYIEPLAAAASRKGMWLPEMYLFDITDDNAAGYVWARDEAEKLEKRPVMLGQYDSGEGLYEILGGLAASDYIALPSEDLVEGGPTTVEGGNMDMSGGMTGDPGLDGSADGSFAVDPDGGLYEEGAVPAEGGDTVGGDTGEGGGDGSYVILDDDTGGTGDTGDGSGDVGGDTVQ